MKGQGAVNREKLARLCEMLGSSCEQERATAARMATAMLRGAGVTWTEVVEEAFGVARPSQAHHPAPGAHYAGAADGGGHTRGDFARKSKSRAGRPPGRTNRRHDTYAERWLEVLLEYRSRLTPWEVQFLEVLASNGRRGREIWLTERQWLLIESLAERLGLYAQLFRANAARRPSRDAQSGSGGHLGREGPPL